jgi:hypothetical protein
LEENLINLHGTPGFLFVVILINASKYTSS